MYAKEKRDEACDEGNVNILDFLQKMRNFFEVTTITLDIRMK